MKNIVLIGGFLIMVVAQWYVPGQMIMYKEKILSTGKEFRFRTEPYDPYDAFRGKYVHLAFSQTSIQVKDSTYYEQGEKIYALISTDTSGFARITGVTKDEPGEETDYLEVTAGYVYTDSITTVSFNYPFDRFYMEESKAEHADAAYMEAQRDTSKITFALVRIQKGEGIVEDVIIDGKPIREVAIERQKAEEQSQ
jgi:uncharacterized membrane-anchored protein